MTGTEWILIDTETSGLTQPVYCVELAAQRMCGVTAVGAPFRALLNHDVPIDPMAQSIHGYSQTYLRQEGRNPREVHAAFCEYAGNLPVVAFNLSFDWKRVLEPETRRLGLVVSYRPGFCALTLARRCIHEVAGHGLQRLRAHFFPYHRGVAHRAMDDVVVTARLIAEVLWPRLEQAGVTTFTDVAKFSRATPVAACRERLTQARVAVSAAPVESHAGATASAPQEREPALRQLLNELLSAAVLLMSGVAQLRRWLEANRSHQSELAMRCRGLVEVAFGESELSPDDCMELRTRLARVAAEKPAMPTAAESKQDAVMLWDEPRGSSVPLPARPAEASPGARTEVLSSVLPHSISRG